MMRMSSESITPTLPWNKAAKGKHAVEVCSGNHKYVGTLESAMANCVVCKEDEIPDDEPVLGTVFFGPKGLGASLRLPYRKGGVAIDVKRVTFS